MPSLPLRKLKTAYIVAVRNVALTVALMDVACMRPPNNQSRAKVICICIEI